MVVAEVDGNRTRRTGIARPTRFEGGGAHQVLGHLRGRRYRSDAEEIALDTNAPPGRKLRPMKKLLVLIVVVALAAFAVKKLQDA